MVYNDVLLDGGSGVNILSETEFLILKKVSLEPAPFQVRMADQRRVQPIGMLRSQTRKIHGIQFLVNFVVLQMDEEAKSYSMLLGRPRFKTAKLKQDWEKQEVIMKKSKKIVKIPMVSKETLPTSSKPRWHRP